MRFFEFAVARLMRQLSLPVSTMYGLLSVSKTPC